MSLAFLGYFLAVLGIAACAWWRTRNLGDYLLGGRRLGPTAAALSAGASDMSGWLLMGLPGLAYAAGLEAAWLALALLAGSYANWLWVAPRLRTLSAELDNALTLPEYFARRAPSGGRPLRLVCGCLILVFYLFYTASGFVAGGKLFATVYGIDYHLALLIGVLVIVAYTFAGGFLAVVWTDVLQGLMMMFALLCVPLFALARGEGSAGLPGLEWLPRDGAGHVAWLGLLSSLAWGLGYFGQPHILARFMALRAGSRVAVARRIALTWTAVCLLGALAVGFAAEGVLGAGVIDPETVFMRLVEVLFHPVVAGVLLAAIMAAIMSTADSQLLVASSVLAEDLGRGVFKVQWSERRLLWLGRGSVLVMAVLALAVAWDRDSGVLDLVGYAWAGFGASLGPALIVSLYWPQVSGYALLAGMLAGGGVVVIWRGLEGGWFELYEMLPGILASLSAMAVVHLALRFRSRA